MRVCVFVPCPGWALSQQWAGLQQQWGRKQVQQGAWPPAGEQLGSGSKGISGSDSVYDKHSTVQSATRRL